ncbi:hypothetical protein [Kitasatospora sp. NPDC005856]|uniref:hypothetical protein n=1 Tax=Kitasatospora sp. NPDC005856 TaxID=3154566 RepID=UPI0033D5A5FE
MTTPPPPPPSGPDPRESWRKAGPSVSFTKAGTIPPQPTHPPATVYTPVPIGAGPAAPSVEDLAAAFWAPARAIFAEQATAIADQIGQLLTETAAQRAAREQVEYEERLAGQRARMDGAFAKVGETAAERAERHRVEDVLVPGPGGGRDDFVALVDRLADRLTETPEDRARREETERETEKRRARAREDKAYADAGETPAQRTRRHRQQKLADQREAAVRARRARRRAARATGPSDRNRRFRRWCVLTAISAIGGYSIGLIPMLSAGGPAVGALAAAFGWGLDLYTRDRGRMRVSEVSRPLPLLLLIVLRVPVASGLVVALGLGPLLSNVPALF